MQIVYDENLKTLWKMLCQKNMAETNLVRAGWELELTNSVMVIWL